MTGRVTSWVPALEYGRGLPATDPSDGPAERRSCCRIPTALRFFLAHVPDAARSCGPRLERRPPRLSTKALGSARGSATPTLQTRFASQPPDRIPSCVPRQASGTLQAAGMVPSGPPGGAPLHRSAFAAAARVHCVCVCVPAWPNG